MGRLPPQSRQWLQYSGMALEMGVLIFLGVMAGKYLDQRFQMSRPVFTLLGVLLFTAAAIFRVIRSLR
jgi:membrane protein DedA with SNARE-associated domain